MKDRRRIFDDLYSASIDPWKFRTSDYEKTKYQKTMSLLPTQHYGTAVEAGCSIGELSRLLGDRCDVFYGLDVSQVAITEARIRNADRPHMEFSVGELPQSWPEVEADLIVLSEFLYFLSRGEIDELASVIARNWAAAGDCVLVSFLGNIRGALQGAESASVFLEALGTRTPFKTVAEHASDCYRIDIVKKR